MFTLKFKDVWDMAIQLMYLRVYCRTICVFDQYKIMIPLIFHPIYSELDLPVRHRFPIEKYQGIYDALIKRKRAA